MKVFQRQRKIFYLKLVKKIDRVGQLGFFNRFIFILNALVALVFLLACLAPYFTWELFSFLAFLSLLLPYLVLVNFLFFLYWLIRKKKQLFLSLTVLLIGYFTQGTFIKIFNANDVIKEGEISLLTLNTQGFKGPEWTADEISSTNIISFIRTQDADIVCLQELDRVIKRQFKNYPYKYQTSSSNFRSKQAILSKYPIIANGSLNFPNSSNNAIYADIVIENDTVRIYNVHLQSLKFRAGMLKREEPLRLYNRLDKSFLKQVEQAKSIKTHSSEVSYKTVICGDLNNTQFSRVYKTIKGEMNDSFEEKGFGFGSTYMFKFLPFRIDFILADPEFEIRSHKNFKVRLSDHEPIMASFRLKD